MIISMIVKILSVVEVIKCLHQHKICNEKLYRKLQFCRKRRYCTNRKTGKRNIIKKIKKSVNIIFSFFIHYFIIFIYFLFDFVKNTLKNQFFSHEFCLKHTCFLVVWEHFPNYFASSRHLKRFKFR
jgi:hypothetical protein